MEGAKHLIISWERKPLQMQKKRLKQQQQHLYYAENPVLSVNGNTAALVPEEIVKLANVLDAKIEINLFYRTPKRIKLIEEVLEDAGADNVLGTDNEEKV